MSVVGPIDCEKGHSITWGVGNGILGRLCEYDRSGNHLDYWNPTINPRTTTLSNNASSIKVSFSTDALNYAYIYDNTNNEYLWKGVSV